jgi:hypothetical protein
MGRRSAQAIIGAVLRITASDALPQYEIAMRRRAPALGIDHALSAATATESTVVARWGIVALLIGAALHTQTTRDVTTETGAAAIRILRAGFHTPL